MAEAPGARRRPVLVIGVGNPLRCDDAVGLEVAAQLRTRGDAQGIEVREQWREATALLEMWADADAVVLIDAAHSGAPPGTIHRFDASAHALPAELRGSSSTHAVGIDEAIELARALQRLPGRLVVYAVEGAYFQAGAGLSREVRAATGELVERVLGEALELAAVSAGH